MIPIKNEIALENCISKAATLFLSSLYTSMDKSMCNSVNKPVSKACTFFYVNSCVVEDDLSTDYPHSANDSYSLKREALKKSVDRLSPYSQCLLTLLFKYKTLF